MVGVEVVVEVAAVVQVAVAASSFWVAAISGAQKVKDVEDCLKIRPDTLVFKIVPLPTISLST